MGNVSEYLGDGVFNYSFAQQGWQCPICKRVYSPHTFMCYYCSNQETVASTGTEYKTTTTSNRKVIIND